MFSPKDVVGQRWEGLSSSSPRWDPDELVPHPDSYPEVPGSPKNAAGSAVLAAKPAEAPPHRFMLSRPILGLGVVRDIRFIGRSAPPPEPLLTGGQKKGQGSPDAATWSAAPASVWGESGPFQKPASPSQIRPSARDLDNLQALKSCHGHSGKTALHQEPGHPGHDAHTKAR